MLINQFFAKALKPPTKTIPQLVTNSQEETIEKVTQASNYSNLCLQIPPNQTNMTLTKHMHTVMMHKVLKDNASPTRS